MFAENFKYKHFIFIKKRIIDCMIFTNNQNFQKKSAKIEEEISRIEKSHSMFPEDLRRNVNSYFETLK